MIINVDFHDECELYTQEIKESVEEVFQYVCKIKEFRKVLANVKTQAVKMNKLFLTDEEKKERKEMLDFFDTRMQAMTVQTLKNMEQYQIGGWKEIIYDGDNEDED